MSQLTAALKSLPSITTRHEACAAAAVNGKLYAVGGLFEDSIDFYDVVNGGQWTQALSKMSEWRCGCAAAAIGNSVYVVGGRDEFLLSLSSVEAFNIETGLWRTLPSMRTERDGCAAVSVGNQLFIFGGLWKVNGATRKSLNTAESYNIKTGFWEDLLPMNNGRFRCAAAVINNKIYVVGGYDTETRSILDTVEVFDLMTRTWMLLPHRMTTRRNGCATAAVGMYLIVAGGHDGRTSLNTVEVFDVKTETWSELPPMTTKRDGCAAVSLGGSVFIMGGQGRTVEEIPFRDDVVKGMLVEWSGGSWRNDVSPLLHRRTSVVHKLDVDISSMPTLLSRMGGESRVQTVYEILRGDMGVFKHTWRPMKRKRDYFY